MNPYLQVSGLDATTCAGLLGYSPHHFQEWAAEQRPIPPSVAAHLASVLGVDVSDLLTPSRKPIDETTIMPAVWFKLRSQGLGTADRELVLLVRQLGIFYEELEQVRSERSSSWKLVFEQIRQEVNAQAPPREQGRVAAQAFRRLREWNKGRSGIGEILRGSLRALGILIVESPIAESTIEGCAFPVGASQRPCIFVNTHKTTWFRRNVVILHELAHLIFDLGSGAALDIFDSPPSKDELSERRAEAFAEEAALPHEVLAHLSQRHGISWASPITADHLAVLAAEAHTEPRQIIRSAIEHGLLDRQRMDDLLQLPAWERLKTISDHALSTKEYLAKVGREEADDWIAKRSTSIPSRKLMLPVNYVNGVVEACREGLISIGRAARLLMISEDTFVARFDATWLLDEE